MSNLNSTLSAISHPSRRAMLARLSGGRARVTEIAKPFGMSLNAVSKHLKVLEGAGLIRREKQGREHFIEIKAEPLRQVTAWLHDYERYWTEHLNKVEEHFKNKNKKKENPS